MAVTGDSIHFKPGNKGEMVMLKSRKFANSNYQLCCAALFDLPPAPMNIMPQRLGHTESFQRRGAEAAENRRGTNVR
jgi:hypothetical protein